MLILPAIDILGGNCVRLIKGEYDSAHKVAADPFEVAADFERTGAEMLHIIDLDGAKDGSAANFDVIVKLANSVSIPVEVGGGIRDMRTAQRYLEAGCERVILGTSALRCPDFVREAVRNFGERAAVGIDARSGFVCVEGWTESSQTHYIEFAKMMADIGVANIIFTDIDRDGTLTEPNFEQLSSLQKSVSIKITASGGIKDISHIKKLAEMKLYAAICGKSLYAGTLDLAQALEVARAQVAGG